MSFAGILHKSFRKFTMEPNNKKRAKKRRRTVISPEEMEKLEESFSKEPKPDRMAKLELAKELSKPENFINIWFQNRRAKERKMSKTNIAENDTFPKSGQSVTESTSNVIDTPPLFRRMVLMAAASEGGILPFDCNEVGSAITDAYRGIRLRDGLLQYNIVTGFEMMELE